MLSKADMACIRLMTDADLIENRSAFQQARLEARTKQDLTAAGNISETLEAVEAELIRRAAKLDAAEQEAEPAA